jgi:hypothetical protein
MYKIITEVGCSEQGVGAVYHPGAPYAVKIDQSPVFIVDDTTGLYSNLADFYLDRLHTRYADGLGLTFKYPAA